MKKNEIYQKKSGIQKERQKEKFRETKKTEFFKSKPLGGRCLCLTSTTALHLQSTTRLRKERCNIGLSARILNQGTINWPATMNPYLRLAMPCVPSMQHARSLAGKTHREGQDASYTVSRAEPVALGSYTQRLKIPLHPAG